MGLLSKLTGKVASKTKDAYGAATKVASKAKDLYVAKKNIVPDAINLGAKAVSDVKAGKGLGAIGRGEGLSTTQNTTVGAIKGAGETVISLGKLGDKGLAKLTSPLTKSVSQTPEMQAKIDQAKTAMKPVGTAQTVGYAGEKIAEAFAVPTKRLTNVTLKTLGGAQKVTGAFPVVGKVLGKNAPKAVQTLIQSSADGLVGAGQSVITDLAKGEKDWKKIAKNAKTSAALSVALPLAVGGTGGLIKGASHQVGQKEGVLKTLKNMGEETLAGAGLVNTPQRALDRAGNLGYQMSKKLAKAEMSENDVVSSAAKGMRDITNNWLDDRAPIMRDFVGRIKEAGGSSDDAAEALNAVQRTKNVDARVLGKAYKQNAAFAQIAAGDDIAKLVDDTDEYADMMTKLETVRTGDEGVASLQRVQDKMDEFVASRKPEELEKIKQAHEATVRAYNQAELAEDVAAGLISQEAADAAMAKYPNYSKQVILEYFKDGAKEGSKNKMIKTLSDIGWKGRVEKARGDLNAMSATQANLLGTMIRDKKRSVNQEIMTMVKMDAKYGAGVFEPVWTIDDEITKKEILGRMRIQTGFKEALVDEISNVKELGKLELTKQKKADIAEAKRIAKEIRLQAKKKGSDVKGVFKSIFDQDRKNVIKEGAKEINKQTSAITKEASRQSKAVGAILGRSGSSFARKSVMKDLAGYNETKKNLVAQELGLIDELANKFSSAADEQAALYSRIGKEASLTASKSFLDDALETRWSKIMSATDTELIPLIDDLQATNAEKQLLFKQFKELRDKTEGASPLETVTVFNNGVKETYIIRDSSVLDYFKKVEKEDNSKIMKVLKFAGDWTRKTATQYNPVFGFKNAIIDYQNANSNLPAGMTLAIDEWIDGFTKSKQLVSGLKPGEKVDDTIQYMMDNGIPLTSFGKELSKKDSKALSSIIKGKEASMNPLNVVMDGISQSELATRYAVVKAAKRAGITDPNQIRELAKNATIDFSVSGSTMKEVNKIVPFLNARTQALRNTLTAIAKDPAGFTRKQQLMSIYPQLMVDQWNKRFDLSRIPEYERDNNIILVLGEKTDEDGNKDIKRISIPRSDGQKIFPKIMEAMMDETKTAAEKTAQMVKSFAQFSPVDGMPQLGGSFGNAITGLRTNKDWRGYDIVPQSSIDGPNRSQVSKSTSPTIRKGTEFLAKLTGQTETSDGAIDLSPKKTEFLAKTIGGGVTTQILKGADAAFNYADTGELNMSKLPGVDVAYREDALPVDPKIVEQNKEFEKADKLKKFNTSEKAKELLNQIKETPKEERGALLDKLSESGELTADVQEKMKAEVKKKGYVGGVNPSASNLIKSKEILTYLDKAKTPEEKSARYDELEKANLLSDGAKDYMMAWKFVEKLNEAKTPAEKEAIIDKFAPKMTEEVKKAAIDIKKMQPYLK